MERDGGLPNTASDFGELFDGTLPGGDDMNGMVIPEGNNHVYHHHQLQFMGGGDEESGGGEHEDEAMHPLSEFQFMEEVGEYGVEQSHPNEEYGVDGVNEGTEVESMENGQCNGDSEGYSTPVGTSNPEEEEDEETGDTGDSSERQTRTRVVKDVEYFGRININTYLQRRKYGQERKTLTKGQVARFIRPEVSLLNMVLNGSNYETEDIFTEYDRFWKFYSWMKVRNVCMSSELKPMLIPMLAFFFRELYISRLLQQAFKLVTDFCKRLVIEEKSKESRAVLVKLVEIQNPKQFEEDEVLSTVYTREHRFVLSEWTFTHLKRFLSKPRRTVLVNLFSRFFIIELRSTQELIERYIDNEDEKTESEANSKEDSEVFKVLKELRSSVRANLPSVIAYTTNGWPISGAISPAATTVAYGMRDCGIRIFNSKSAKKLFASEEECDSSIEVPDVRTVSGHRGSVYGIDFHPRTKLLFSAGEDKTLRAWDFCHQSETPCRAVYRGHLGPIWSMNITKSGHLLATGSSDSTARIWVPERSDCVRVLVGHYYDVDAVTFHPNEAYLATGSVDKSVRFWSVSEGKISRMMTGSKGRIAAITFDKSGKYLIAGGEEDTVRIWDVAEGAVVAELPSPTHCKDLTICGNMLAGCFNNGTVALWNLRRIIGGGEVSEELESLNSSLTHPHVVACRTKSVFRLLYKDPSNLFCLGVDPSLKSSKIVIKEWESPVQVQPSLPSAPPSVPSCIPSAPSAPSPSPSPIQLSTSTSTTPSTSSSKFNSQPEPVAEPDAVISQPLASSSPVNHSTSPVAEEETGTFIDEPEGDNTNNTITSSDMEFEVDEQMLQSLVDGTLL